MFSGGKSFKPSNIAVALPLDFVVFKRPDPSEAKDPSCWERPKLPPCHGASEVHIFPEKKKLFWVFVQSWKTEQKNGSTNIKTYHIVSKCIKTKTVIKMYINDVGTSSPLFLALPWFFSVKGHMNPEHLLKHSRVRVVEGMKKIHHPFQFLRDFQVSQTQTNRMVNIYHISITISIKITWNHDNITQTLLDPISDQRREYAP